MIRNMAVAGLMAILVGAGCSRAGEVSSPAATPAEKAGVVWVENFEEAKRLAAERNLPILADFTGSDWCGWCIKLKKEVFSQPAFAAYAKENLVLFVADFPRKPQAEPLKKQNRELAERFGIEGYPTILILNAEGREMARTGYRPGGAEDYVAHLKSLIGR